MFRFSLLIAIITSFTICNANEIRLYTQFVGGGSVMNASIDDSFGFLPQGCECLTTFETDLDYYSVALGFEMYDSDPIGFFKGGLNLELSFETYDIEGESDNAYILARDKISGMIVQTPFTNRVNINRTGISAAVLYIGRFNIIPDDLELVLKGGFNQEVLGGSDMSAVGTINFAQHYEFEDYDRQNTSDNFSKGYTSSGRKDYVYANTNRYSIRDFRTDLDLRAEVRTSLGLNFLADAGVDFFGGAIYRLPLRSIFEDIDYYPNFLLINMGIGVSF